MTHHVVEASEPISCCEAAATQSFWGGGPFSHRGGSSKTDLGPGPGHCPGHPASPECADADHYSGLHQQVRLGTSNRYSLCLCLLFHIDLMFEPQI